MGRELVQRRLGLAHQRTEQLEEPIGHAASGRRRPQQTCVGSASITITPYGSTRTSPIRRPRSAHADSFSGTWSGPLEDVTVRHRRRDVREATFSPSTTGQHPVATTTHDVSDSPISILPSRPPAVSGIAAMMAERSNTTPWAICRRAAHAATRARVGGGVCGPGRAGQVPAVAPVAGVLPRHPDGVPGTLQVSGCAANASGCAVPDRRRHHHGSDVCRSPRTTRADASAGDDETGWEPG